MAPELVDLANAFDAAERDARAVVAGLTEAQGAWRTDATSWSVAECLDHLATSNRVYLAAMRPAAERAKARGRLRRRPARPGLLGGWLVRTLEPPVRRRRTLKAPAKIQPRRSPALDDASRAFFASQDDIRAFMRAYAGIDLAGVHFPNPFIPVLRWSLATGLHVLDAHERRHLAQAWRVRKAMAGELRIEN